MMDDEQDVVPVVLCEARVPHSADEGMRCAKEKGHNWGHQVLVKDTLYTWGDDLARLHEPKRDGAR